MHNIVLYPRGGAQHNSHKPKQKENRPTKGGRLTNTKFPNFGAPFLLERTHVFFFPALLYPLSVCCNLLCSAIAPALQLLEEKATGGKLQLVNYSQNTDLTC